MPKHHYLPACFLARFSTDPTSIASRDRTIFVGDKKTKNVFAQKAGNTGAINNLYSFFDSRSDPELLEKKFSEFESELNPAIENLIKRKLNTRMWLRILVPFVTCMLVRDPGFSERFERRLEDLGLGDQISRFNPNNSNDARLIEIQRLIGSITIAKWIVVNTTGSEKLITNDIGFSPFINISTGDRGISIPLDHNHTLAIVPRTKGQLLRFSRGKWKPIVQYVVEPKDSHNNLNRSLAQNALRFIFSPEENLVNKYLVNSKYDPKYIEPVQLGFLGEPHARAFEFTWHQLASTLENNSSKKKIDDFSIDWKDLLLGWYPSVIVPTNLVKFPSILERRGNYIVADVYDPEVYYKLSRIIDYERMNEYEMMLEESIEGIEYSTDVYLRCEFKITKSNALIALNRRPEAFKELNEIIDLKPDFLNAWINRAAFFLENGELEQAYDDLMHAQKIDPESGIVFLNLGVYHLKKNEYQQSIQEINKAIDRLPKGPLVGKAYLSLGLTYSAIQRHKEAIVNFNLAIQNIRDKEALAFCHFQKAILESSSFQHNQEHIRETIDDLTKSYHFTQKSNFLYEILALRSELFQSLNLLDLALIDIEEAQNIQNDTRVIFIKADILLQMGLYFQAMGQFQNLLYSGCDLNPMVHAKINNNLGICNFMLGNFSAATSFFSKAIDLFNEVPESGSPIRYMGQIHLLKGDFKKAHECLYNAKNVDPNSPFNRLLEGIITIYEGNGHQSIEILSSGESSPEIIFFTILGSIINNENNDALEVLHTYLNYQGASALIKAMMLIHLESLSIINNDRPIFKNIQLVIKESIR